MDTNSKLDQFSNMMSEVFSLMDTSVQWPLNGGQIDAYFDVEESLSMYSILNDLSKNHSIKEIAKMLPPADVIRLFIEHNAIIGLKVAKKLGIKNITTQERIDYTLFLFDILEQKVRNDIFCLDGKNLILNNDELDILLHGNWHMIKNTEEQKQLSYLNITTNNLCYTLYYDLFMAGGFYIHGPYNAPTVFGPNTILLIRDYHDIFPKDIWPDLVMPCKKMKILGIYRDLDISINFMNHPMSLSPVGSRLIAYKIILDDKEIDLEQAISLEAEFEKVATQQSARVNFLSNIDKVRKGADIAYYLFKDFRTQLDIDWRPPKIVEETIQKFGETFIEKYIQKEKPPKEHWAKLFDPRIDYY